MLHQQPTDRSYRKYVAPVNLYPQNEANNVVANNSK